MSTQAPQRTPPTSRRSRTWNWVRKSIVLLIGVPVMLLGLVMMVTPGPGTPVLIAGLAILSIEFAWARRHVDRVRRGARHVLRRASGDVAD